MSKYYALISIIYYALVVFISMMFIKNIFIYIFISVTAMLLGKYFVIDFDRFKNSVLYAIKIAIGGGAGIDDFLNHLEQNRIDKVNIILPYTVNKFETGIYVEIPEEDEMQIRPRSGISSSTLMSVKLGTIDTDYRGNIGIIVQNPTPFSYIIIPNSRLAQGVIVEKKRAVFDIKSSKDELSKTERGENGFGKSGLM